MTSLKKTSLCWLLIFAPVVLFSSCSPAKTEKKPVVVKPVVKPKPKPKISYGKAISTHYGIASWYSIKTNFGTKTASGRRLYNHAYTAAHKKFPMGSKVRVTNLRNGRSEILTITDRGPYIKGRIIDVTVGSAKRLGFYSNGITRCKVQLLKRGNWRYKH